MGSVSIVNFSAIVLCRIVRPHININKLQFHPKFKNGRRKKSTGNGLISSQKYFQICYNIINHSSLAFCGFEGFKV